MNTVGVDSGNRKTQAGTGSAATEVASKSGASSVRNLNILRYYRPAATMLRSIAYSSG